MENYAIKTPLINRKYSISNSFHGQVVIVSPRMHTRTLGVRLMKKLKTLLIFIIWKKICLIW